MNWAAAVSSGALTCRGLMAKKGHITANDPRRVLNIYSLIAILFDFFRLLAIVSVASSQLTQFEFPPSPRLAGLPRFIG